MLKTQCEDSRTSMTSRTVEQHFQLKLNLLPYRKKNPPKHERTKRREKARHRRAGHNAIRQTIRSKHALFWFVRHYSYSVPPKTTALRGETRLSTVESEKLCQLSASVEKVSACVAPDRGNFQNARGWRLNSGRRSG